MTTNLESRFDHQGAYHRLQYRDGVLMLAQGLASAPERRDPDEAIIFLGGDAITWLIANAAVLERLIANAPPSADPDCDLTSESLKPTLDEHGQPVLYEVDAVLHVVWPEAFARDRRVTAAHGSGLDHDHRFRLDEPLDLPAGWQGTLELDVAIPAVEQAIHGQDTAAHTVTWSLGVVVLEEQDGVLAVHLTRPPEVRDAAAQEAAR